MNYSIYPTKSGREQIASNGFAACFQRTLRIPDDGKVYPLPPGLGSFPVFAVADYKDSVPEAWLKAPGTSYFIPMYQREALWVSFAGSNYRAVKIGVGNVCALTGEIWDDSPRLRRALKKSPQNYLVAGLQPWLDGIKSAQGTIRQFIAMPLGMGYTVEGQITGSEDFGGIQFSIFEPKEGSSAARPKVDRFRSGSPLPAGGAGSMIGYSATHSMSSMGGVICSSFAGGSQAQVRSSAFRSLSPVGRAEGAEMGLGAGGQMDQQIYPDQFGVDSWKKKPELINVFICNSASFQQITGQLPPPTPVSAATYTQHGYPWFDIYDDHLGDIDSSETLEAVKSIKEMDQEHGFGPLQDDTSIVIGPGQVQTYTTWPKPTARHK